MNKDCNNNELSSIGNGKRCSSCKKILNLNEFGISSDTPSGLNNVCKACRRYICRKSRRRLKNNPHRQRKTISEPLSERNRRILLRECKSGNRLSMALQIVGCDVEKTAKGSLIFECRSFEQDKNRFYSTARITWKDELIRILECEGTLQNLIEFLVRELSSRNLSILENE